MSTDRRIPSVVGFVAVIGPPAVGKSTVTGALAARFSARLFRLREFAHEFRARSGVDQRLFDTGDPLGWFREETVALLLQAAFPQGRFPAQPIEPYATSLIVRGPAVKDRFLVTDRVTSQAWWQYGAATESPDDAARKQMNTSQANACLQELIERRILI